MIYTDELLELAEKVAARRKYGSLIDFALVNNLNYNTLRVRLAEWRKR